MLITTLMVDFLKALNPWIESEQKMLIDISIEIVFQMFIPRNELVHKVVTIDISSDLWKRLIPWNEHFGRRRQQWGTLVILGGARGSRA